MICYLFPPLGGSGVQRSAKFARYLPDSGWCPLVIAARGRYLKQLLGYDHTLAAEVRNVRNWRFGEWCLRPFLDAFADILWDTQMVRDDRISRQFSRIRNAAVDWTDKFFRWRAMNPWVLNAALWGIRVVRKYNARVVYSSHPPVYSHLAASVVSRATGIPWVADYRDPFTSRVDWYDQVAPRWYANRLRRMERKLIRQASAVVSVGDMHSEDMQHCFGDIAPEKFITIRNGYDPIDFEVAPTHGSGDVTIIHTGNVYWGSRDPTVFMEAVADWVGPGGMVPGVGRLRIDFIGGDDSMMLTRIRRLRLQGIVHASRRVDHQTCVSRLLASDLALVITSPGSSKHGLRTLPGKLYEALGSQRPLLVLAGDSSEAAAVSRKVGGCWIADVNDRTQIIQCLDSWASCMRSGKLPRRSQKGLKELTRQAQAKHLARILEDVTLNGSR